MLLHRVRPDLYRTNIDIAVLGDFKEFKEEETPGFAISVLTAMMPVIRHRNDLLFHSAGKQSGERGHPSCRGT